VFNLRKFISHFGVGETIHYEFYRDLTRGGVFHRDGITYRNLLNTLLPRYIFHRGYFYRVFDYQVASKQLQANSCIVQLLLRHAFRAL
jgi:hypothetical protein